MYIIEFYLHTGNEIEDLGQITFHQIKKGKGFIYVIRKKKKKREFNF